MTNDGHVFSVQEFNMGVLPINTTNSYHEGDAEDMTPVIEQGFGGSWSDDQWGSTADGWSTEYTFSTEVTFNQNGNPQVIEQTATKYTFWEKVKYDVNDMLHAIGSAIDSAMNTILDRGFVTAGAQVTPIIGFSATVDMQGNVFVGVSAGQVGLTAGAGLTPQGVPTTTYLTGLGATVAVPVANTSLGLGATGALDSPAAAPFIGLAGSGVSYSWQLNKPVPGHSSEQILDVMIGAQNWWNHEMQFQQKVNKEIVVFA